MPSGLPCTITTFFPAMSTSRVSGSFSRNARDDGERHAAVKASDRNLSGWRLRLSRRHVSWNRSASRSTFPRRQEMPRRSRISITSLGQGP
ncbi:MAG: hypothetical protein U0166_18460 [Acidobacteriota bacterium]